jgi:hypothetical protein
MLCTSEIVLDISPPSNVYRNPSVGINKQITTVVGKTRKQMSRNDSARLEKLLGKNPNLNLSSSGTRLTKPTDTYLITSHTSITDSALNSSKHQSNA